MDLDWSPSVLTTLVLSTVTGFLTYQRMRNHRHHRSSTFSASSPSSAASSTSLVIGGSFFVLMLVGLLLLRSAGVFERAPFSHVNAGLANPVVVGTVLFLAAAAPLADDIRHRGQYHWQ